MGSEDIGLELKDIWNAWFEFRKGKKASNDIHEFQYFLEGRLFQLHKDLVEKTYVHGSYRRFIVCDNKRREISVSPVVDRVVHRLLYDYLVPIWDKTFIHDAWSCRKQKGLLGAIERAQGFLQKNPNAYVWRADIRKFFDNVDQQILLKLLGRRVHDEHALWIIRQVISSYSSNELGKGMPIGNLTSQIFSNIYLNELDRFVKHTLGVRSYLRYGDDFLIFEDDPKKLTELRFRVLSFLSESLKIAVNPKNDHMVKTKHGLKFLGVQLWPHGRRLTKRNRKRVARKLNGTNLSSYHGVMAKHEKPSRQKAFHWQIKVDVVDAVNAPDFLMESLMF